MNTRGRKLDNVEDISLNQNMKQTTMLDSLKCQYRALVASLDLEVCFGETVYVSERPLNASSEYDQLLRAPKQLGMSSFLDWGRNLV